MNDRITDQPKENLTYEIRNIVATAQRFEALGQTITWENIGDPVAKGEAIPDWIKEAVKDAAGQDDAYAYAPTKGIPETREFLARQHAPSEGSALNAEDIIFFNGLGDAISHIYDALDKSVRVIGPDPAYPTHAIAEANHASADPLMYRLDPEDGWSIDLFDLEDKLKKNQGIRGILLLNPGNPTGAVLSKEDLEAVVALAKEHGCFLIADAIYDELRYGDASGVALRDVIGEVPTLVMRGLSKTVPWPGARCGWVEFYNTDVDYWADFRERLLQRKMREVCATTLPQKVLPSILSNPKWGEYMDQRNAAYERRARAFQQAFVGIEGVTAIKPNGAYYATVLFAPGVLQNDQSLTVENEQISDALAELVKNANPDKRFTYFLLAAEGVCVVPLSSGFFSRNYGFRMTLLEPDMDTFTQTLEKISAAVGDYLST